MPLIVEHRLMSNREPLGKMTMKKLLAYEKALQAFMPSNSPMIAMALKQIWQEIEWRNSAPGGRKPPRAPNHRPPMEGDHGYNRDMETHKRF